MTYANVMATIAVFIALGGTSYAALKLPRDSVGAKQLKRDAVGRAELRKGAVQSTEIRDASIGIDDVSPGAQAALRGQVGAPGPPGVALHASISSSGATVAGNAGGTEPAGVGRRLIEFARDVTGCTPTATLARNLGGAVSDPGPGAIVVAIEGGKVAVEMYDATGAKTYLPFNLLVAC